MAGAATTNEMLLNHAQVVEMLQVRLVSLPVCRAANELLVFRRFQCQQQPENDDARMVRTARVTATPTASRLQGIICAVAIDTAIATATATATAAAIA